MRERDLSGGEVGPAVGFAGERDVMGEIFPDGMDAWCEDKILLAVVSNADRYGIATGNVTANGTSEPLGIEELARQAQVPLTAARTAVAKLEASRALTRFESNGSDVWVLAAPEDDLAAPGPRQIKCPKISEEGR